MATRSFLLENDLITGRDLLLKSLHSRETLEGNRLPYSEWIEKKLLERLEAVGDFKSLKPVRIGSWARHELCPRSDIDLLFLGEEKKVEEFIALAFRQGLKLRARVPENISSWDVGVEPFDILALGSAEAFDESLNIEVQTQSLHAYKKRRNILAAIRKERETRRKRQDSVASYLEPNIKYGVGGLRDIEQARAVRKLFTDVFEGQESYPFEVLDHVKDKLLYLRALLHSLDSGDVWTANDQLEIGKLLNLDSKKLMKHIQSELERASFYSDWAIAFAGASGEKRRRSSKSTDLSDALTILNKDPSILQQFEVRRKSSDLFKGENEKTLGNLLKKILYPSETSDAFLLSLHRTRLIEGFIPDFKKLRGLVQHDHYHRFTADAHLVQSLREVFRAEKYPRRLGVMRKIAADMTASDWWTLKLASLFHDLAKGGDKDHSTEGAKLVDRYFKEWGYPESLREEVRWLVENHLLLSTAAFRQNPQSRSTWKRLFDRGVGGRRLELLSLFTVIDILATNPEAWTSWKSRLLFDLVTNLQSKGAQSFQEHLRYASKKKIQKMETWILELDSTLFDMFSPRVLIEDLRLASTSAADLPVIAVKGRNGRMWVRFHRKVDRSGLFFEFVRSLYGWGLNVQMSSVHTLAGIGVYDWFCLKTEKTAKQLEKWLNTPPSDLSEIPKVGFQSIDLMSEDKDEWILSFKGKDQRGLLLAAAKALQEENLSLRWARVHTWGNQVEDVFSVRPLVESGSTFLDTLSRLRQRFVT